MEVKSRFSISAKRMSRSIIRELLKLANKPGLISFAGGLPYPGAFPNREIADICGQILIDSPNIVLQYGATEGVPSFRELLVSFLAERGLHIQKEELIITTASQQSLDLVGKIFIDRGDIVITENPSYLGAIGAFKTYGVRFLPIDMDKDGILTSQLHKELKELKKIAGSGQEYYQNMPKFIYTIPDFQNPTGITMSLQRRKELLEIAEDYDLLIIEDVPYKWLRFSGDDQPLVASLEVDRSPSSGERRVVNLFTFSKILSPGIRLGWITANYSIIDKFVQAKQATDLCTSPLTQRIAEEFMRRKSLDSRIAGNIEIYRKKLQVMLESLDKSMPRVPGLHWVVPEGGMFLWIILPEGMDTDEMFKEAVERNVAYVVGSAFFPNGGGHTTMRLNFSFPSEKEIREGIGRLSGLIKSRIRGAA